MTGWTPHRLLEAIAVELRSRDPRRADPGSYDAEAAVGLILRPGPDDLEFLAIKRVEHERDPWSGHMALPGGTREPDDASLRETAIRETREEVGVDLETSGFLIGRLDDVRPRSTKIPAIAISPFVFAVGPEVEVRAGPEVDRTLWISIAVLLDESYRGELFHEAEPDRRFPTIEHGDDVIWGLTLRVLSQFEEILRTLIEDGP